LRPGTAFMCAAPKVARLTVGEWSDKWLDGYRTRRKSAVRQAEVHLKLVKEHFGAVPMASVKPSDVRGWTARLKAGGAGRLVRIRPPRSPRAALQRRRA
jgi:hypothetical protein